MRLLSWLQRLFSTSIPKPQPRPPEWRKTLNDLQAENRNLSGEEMEWARDYEREQLRSWARFPRDGELFEALHDIKITYLTHWRAPYTGGGEAFLPKGARVRVSVHTGDTEPIGVYAVPVEEKLFEQRFVPESDRTSSKYEGYSVSVRVAQLNRDFQLVQSNGIPHEH